ncbi:ABC transporter ATP-binding protein [Hydrogenibacillus schlegelii]|uniref:ABC transporter ATP-binding protein n=1 Tax=Hydrogenibacillus schlegelii TaxID=1484 RepID=UPI002353370C|nr:ABC transporter ATP-binding protein [Hydrogenibacillus schlegelii]
MLHEIELNLGPGFHVLLGPNGAGKTTLFRVLAGVLRPWRGEVRIEGRDLARDLSVRTKVAYVPQRDTLYPSLTVRDNLFFFAQMYGLSEDVARQRVSEVVEELQLGEFLTQAAGTLSGGQKRRANLARALLATPRVLLLDEPTTGLDPILARSVRQLLQGLAREGQLILTATHNLYEAAELAEAVILIHRGRIIHRGSVEDLKGRLGLRRVGFRTTGDPRPVFAQLGLESRLEGGLWVTEVSEEEQVSRAVFALVTSGLSVLEVRELDNPLESLFDALTAERL